MKIEKFNETKLNRTILIDFIEDIMEYFYTDDGAVAVYYSNLSKHNNGKFFLELQLQFIESVDLENFLKIYEYIKSFDNNSYWIIYAEHVDEGLDATCFKITINNDKYDEINNDLKIKLNSKKYNL